MSSVQSISSSELTGKTHPNALKADEQLVKDGLVVITAESRGDSGPCIILTDSPSKYSKDGAFHIKSIHWYQSKLPRQLEDRNKLCAQLVARRGDPLIKPDFIGKPRTQFLRSHVPNLDLDDAPAQESTRTKYSRPERHIEDMFAEMRRSNEVKKVDLSAASSSRVTLSEKGSKIHQTKVSPLMKAFQLQAQRGCCKKKSLKLTEETVKASEANVDVKSSTTTSVKEESEADETVEERKAESSRIEDTLPAEERLLEKFPKTEDATSTQDETGEEDTEVLNPRPQKRSRSSPRSKKTKPLIHASPRRKSQRLSVSQKQKDVGPGVTESSEDVGDKCSEEISESEVANSEDLGKSEDVGTSSKVKDSPSKKKTRRTKHKKR